MNSLNIRKQVVALVIGLALLMSVGVTAGAMGVAEVEPVISIVGGIDDGGGC